MNVKFEDIKFDNSGYTINDLEFGLALMDSNKKELVELTINILNEYSSKSKLIKANKALEILLFLLEERKLYDPNSKVKQSFLDILISACLVHNVVKVDATNWKKVFEIREIICEEAANFKVIPNDMIDAICDAVENQLGQHIPIKGCKPNPNTPGELLSYAIALTNNFSFSKK